MNKYCIKLVSLVAVVMAAVVSSCSNDEWDRHYNNTDYVLSDKSLSEYIKSQPEMSIFYDMLEISGYDTILNTPQTFTVWAPNNVALQGIDMTNVSKVTELVMNHISRFSYPTSGLNSEKIYMLSKKFVQFSKAIDGYYFGSSLLTGSNVSTKNGIVHTISTFESYAPNIWEALDRISDIDLMRQYYYSMITVDEYDVENNFILEQLGALDNEDSVYTVLFPNNQAWTMAYDSIKDYFITRDEDGGAALQHAMTQFSIVKNTVFSKVTNPFSLDSITSTMGNGFKTPSRLFEGATPFAASNGMIYITDSMRYGATESWHKEIRIEAEATYYGRTPMNAFIFPRTTEGTGFSASNNSYITVDPTVTNNISKIAVTFSIPSTLSATYNMYCVFIPESITDSSNHKTYMANFYLDYVNAAGTLIKNKSLVKNLKTNADVVTKLYIGQQTFSFCNIYNGSNADINVKIKVENAVSTSQTTTMSRTMRIDCIILEPVN